MKRFFIRYIFVFVSFFMLSSCQIGSRSYSVGGTISVSILATSVIITDPKAGSITVNTSANPVPFTLPNQLMNGSSYNVTATSVTGGVKCNVNGGTGTINNANVTNIMISC